MEQLKPIIKYHFWILCGVIVLTTIGAGFWAMNGQAGTIGKQVQQIKSAKTDASSVMNVSADVGEGASVSVHPNEETSKGMEEEINVAKGEVMAAWQKLYDQQKDLLGWPLDALPEDLAKVFGAFRAENMAFELNNAELEVPVSYRKQVKEILPRVLPRLAEQIRAKWEMETGTATNGSVDESEMFNQPVAEWDYSDQAQWKSELTMFTGRNGNDDPLGTPTTMQVLYAKENLVLLNGVLQILKKVNEDALTPGQATVKRIQSILIGQQAHSAEPLDFGSMSSGGGSGSGQNSNYQREGMEKYMRSLGKSKSEKDSKTQVSASELETMDPAHMRYVNEQFEPISSSEYRRSVTSQALSDKSWMSIVKRVPVRLTLMVDERRIDDLLEACANGSIPIEVRQFTIIGGQLPDSQKEGKSDQGGSTLMAESTGAAGAGGGLDQMSLSLPGAGGKGSDGKSDGAVESKNFKTTEFNSHFDVPVELYGFMKIYNKPDPEALGAAQKTAEAE